MDSHQRRVKRRAEARHRFLSDLLGQWEPKPVVVPSSPGTLWIYNQHPVLLPGNQTFSVTISYGSTATAEPVPVRINLLGHYTTKVEAG